MSNKSQLQANNTQLATLIQTLQGKIAGSGGGGNVRVYLAGMVADRTQCGNNTITYACPLDELDFTQMTQNNTMVAVATINGTNVEIGDMVKEFAKLGMPCFIQVADSIEGLYNASGVAVWADMSGYGMPPMIITPIMAKITPEVIAAAGLSIEPGIYLVHDAAYAPATSVIYTGP